MVGGDSPNTLDLIIQITSTVRTIAFIWEASYRQVIEIISASAWKRLSLSLLTADVMIGWLVKGSVRRQMIDQEIWASDILRRLLRLSGSLLTSLITSRHRSLIRVPYLLRAK